MSGVFKENFVGGAESLIAAATLLARDGDVVMCNPEDFAMLGIDSYEFKVPIPPPGVFMKDVSRHTCPAFYIRPSVRHETLARGCVWMPAP